MEKHTAEVWVKVIGIVGIVMAALGVLAGLALIFGGGIFASLITMFVPISEGGAFGPALGALFTVIGIVALIVSLFQIFLYIKLMKYVNWARIVVLVFAALGFIGALTSLPGSIPGLIINGVIFYLLMWQKEIVALFK